MKWNKSGLMLADVPNAGVSRRDSNARSGNPAHDVRSGKFGSGSKQKKPRTPAPANVDPAEYARMLDAVRDAARQIETIDEASITEFIQGRANSPEAVDIANFMKMVEEQRKADLVDLLDTALRSKKPKGPIRVTAPRGHVQKLIRVLGSDVVAEIMHRLEAMGHDRGQVDKFFDGRIATAEEAKKKRDAVAASDGLSWILPIETEDDYPDPPSPQVTVVINTLSDKDLDPVEIAQKIQASIGAH